jgi:uncharacterized protein (DUF433 family)
VADSIPMELDSGGVYWIGGTRVTLDLVVRAFDRGATPEEIAQKYTSLELADIYQVIGYYLKHGNELGEYLKRRSDEEDALVEAHREWQLKGLRERLTARGTPG